MNFNWLSDFFDKLSNVSPAVAVAFVAVIFLCAITIKHERSLTKQHNKAIEAIKESYMVAFSVINGVGLDETKALMKKVSENNNKK